MKKTFLYKWSLRMTSVHIQKHIVDNFIRSYSGIKWGTLICYKFNYRIHVNEPISSLVPRVSSRSTTLVFKKSSRWISSLIGKSPRHKQDRFLENSSTFFPEISVSWSWARPYYWKTYPFFEISISQSWARPYY